MKHFVFILVRLLLAMVVVCALPFSHITWGERYPDDGQQEFGFVMASAVIGVAAAALYFGLGSLSQYFLRRRALRYSLLVDFGLFILFTGVLVYGGVTARYHDAQPNHPAGGNARVALQLAIECHWQGMPQPGHSAEPLAIDRTPHRV
jgi:hypothetical protein